MKASEDDCSSPSGVKSDRKDDSSLGVNSSKEQLEKIDDQESCISDRSKTIADDPIEEEKIWSSLNQPNISKKRDSKQREKKDKKKRKDKKGKRNEDEKRSKKKQTTRMDNMNLSTDHQEDFQEVTHR
jgi:hypothetical protein